MSGRVSQNDQVSLSELEIPKNSPLFLFIYLFYLSILSLMLTITEQILFIIKNSNKMLIDVNTLVKKPIEHKTCYI